MEIIEKALEKITAQQPTERNFVWMVGEQLKDFCRASSHDAQLLCNDLDIPELSLEKAEEQIAKRAKETEVRQGNIGTGGVTLQEAEDILRKFYHLSPRGERPPEPAPEPVPEPVPPSAPPRAVSVSLDDFL